MVLESQHGSEIHSKHPSRTCSHARLLVGLCVRACVHPCTHPPPDLAKKKNLHTPTLNPRRLPDYKSPPFSSLTATGASLYSSSTSRLIVHAIAIMLGRVRPRLPRENHAATTCLISARRRAAERCRAPVVMLVQRFKHFCIHSFIVFLVNAL